MSRRHRAEGARDHPDAKFGDIIVTKFMNSIMYAGKKSVAETIVYGAFESIEGKVKTDPLAVFKQALENVAPAIEVRSRRVGGATYRLPVEVRMERRQALAIRWIIQAARARNDKTMVDRLSQSCWTLPTAAATLSKKREDTHRMGGSQPRLRALRW